MKAAAEGVRPVSFRARRQERRHRVRRRRLRRGGRRHHARAFANCGQVCLGTERVYVERPIFDKFVAALKEKAEGMKIGRARGRRQQPRSADLQRAPQEGALVLREGARRGREGRHRRRRARDGQASSPKGAWVEPTIWTGLPETATVVREEIFGPCCHIAPFDTEDEAIALANDTHYGLATTVWTQNLARAHRVARQIEVGICWINSWFLRDLRTAFGGAKALGHRPRRRRAFARVLYRAAQCLREALKSEDSREQPRVAPPRSHRRVRNQRARSGAAARRCC